MALFSTTITPTTSVQLVLANKPNIRRVKQILLRMRSMGTATQVSIGGRDSQDIRMVTLGDVVAMDTPAGQRYIDISKLFISSDAADAVVEILGDTYECD